MRRGRIRSRRRTEFSSLRVKRNLDSDTGDLWDSGKTPSSASVNVSYAGKTLAASTTYYWKVQTWDSGDRASPWSAAQAFTMGATVGSYSTAAPPVAQTPTAPLSITQLAAGHVFIDFGRAAFGWLELTFDAPSAGAVVSVSLGEKANGQAVDLAPGGTIRAAKVNITVQQGQHTYRVQTPKDATNTTSPAFPLPASLGVVMPFRYAEVSNAPVALTKDSARQIALAYPFDDGAASFSSSNATLNAVWELARYSIKATTFADIYIDGDRERRPYEADAYIQQLGHYAIDRRLRSGAKEPRVLDGQFDLADGVEIPLGHDGLGRLDVHRQHRVVGQTVRGAEGEQDARVVRKRRWAAEHWTRATLMDIVDWPRANGTATCSRP